MNATLQSVAKAIAAFLTPIVLAILAGVVESAGLNVAFDPSVVETLIVSVLTAVSVWYVRNRPAES